MPTQGRPPLPLLPAPRRSPATGQQAVWTERPARGSLLHAPRARLGFDSATRTWEPPRRVGAEDCHATLHAELS